MAACSALMDSSLPFFRHLVHLLAGPFPSTCLAVDMDGKTRYRGAFTRRPKKRFRVAPLESATHHFWRVYDYKKRVS
jgi:hypothetical protein